MPADRDLLTTLQTLDPADVHADAETPRARADLARILASPRGRDGVSSKPQPRAARRAGRRTLLAGGLVAALTTAVVALPSFTGGDAAYATWTQAPRDLSGPERVDAAATCREQQRAGAGADDGSRLDDAAPVIVEARGAWTTVVLAGADGFSALCVTDSSRRLFDSWIGSLGMAAGTTRIGARQLVATDLGSGTTAAGPLSLAVGVAGSQVTGVSYRSDEHGKVLATVTEGRFALWLPGDELETASRDGVDVDVTYRDGSTGIVRLRL